MKAFVQNVKPAIEPVQIMAEAAALLSIRQKVRRKSVTFAAVTRNA
jgi:hypothetical protein